MSTDAALLAAENDIPVLLIDAQTHQPLAQRRILLFPLLTGCLFLLHCDKGSVFPGHELLFFAGGCISMPRM